MVCELPTYVSKVNLPEIKVRSFLCASVVGWFCSTWLTTLAVSDTSNLIITWFINHGNEVSIMVTTNWTVRN
jgi:hypothetical protein